VQGDDGCRQAPCRFSAGNKSEPLDHYTTPHQDLKKPADGDFSATSPTGTSNARSDRAGNAYFSVGRAAVRRSV
jgi:hypothetical protein